MVAGKSKVSIFEGIPVYLRHYTMQTFNPNALECWICPAQRVMKERQKPVCLVRPIIQFLPDGGQVTHPSIKAASEAVGVSETSIRKAAGKRYSRTHAAGYKWSYA